MNYSTIKYSDIANGEGVRTSLFVSGCRRNCPGCFNAEAFSFSAGKPFTREEEDKILESLQPFYVDGLTVLGGEPMEPENQRDLLPFLKRVRTAFPDQKIWCFTGFTYEVLTGQEQLEPGSKEARGRTDVTDELLGYIDVLVDGPFEEELHDITLRFRGSSNQRIIDLAATRTAGSVVLWEDDPLFQTHTM